MSEIEILELSLWIFCFGFVAKCVIFAFLRWTLRGQRDKSRVGSALRSHYVSLSTQAAGLAFIFFYYASVVSGWGSWLDEKQRITMYIVDTALVLWATERGVNLMLTYLESTGVRVPLISRFRFLGAQKQEGD